MKNDISIYFDIIKSVRTIPNRDQLSLEIGKVMESLFSKENQSFEEIFKEISVNTGEELKKIFKKAKLEIKNKEDIKDCLQKLKELLEKFKVVKLTIALEPTPKIIEEISEWISSKLGVGYIIDINTDQNIMGGAIVVLNGRYQELTVEKGIESAFQNNKKDILPNL